MHDYILLVFPILLFAITFYGAKLAGKGEIAPAYLRREQTGFLQAAASIAIIIHHVTQQISGYGSFDKGPITVFNYAGILFTALFFFCSGYGLITSLYTKKDYLRTFLKNRLPKVLIPFWMINILGVIYHRFAYNTHRTPYETLQDISGITLLNTNAWFVIEIVIFYLAFYIIFTLIKNRNIALSLYILSICFFIYFCFNREYIPDVRTKAKWFMGEWWYNSSACFVFGVIYARIRSKIDKYINKLYPLFLVVFAALFVGLFYYSIYAVNHYGYYSYFTPAFYRHNKMITFAAQTAACLVFIILVLLINMKITLGNKLIARLSRISTEIFLIHGYFVDKVFNGVRMKFFTRYTVIIASSLICAALVAVPIRFIVSKIVHLLSYYDNKPHDTLESKLAEERREKVLKKIRLAVLLAIIVGAGIYAKMRFGRYLFTAKRYKQECEAIKNANPGDIVYWGYYDTVVNDMGEERLEWIVVSKDDEKACLLCKQGIAGSYYNQKHTEVIWKECDLRQLLNSGRFMNMFSRYEKESLVPVDGDVITLMTVEEAESFFKDDKSRELSITEVAEAEKTNINTRSKFNTWDMKGYRSSWWWLRGVNEEAEIKAPIVSVDGAILTDENYVNRPSGAIRPLIWVKY